MNCWLFFFSCLFLCVCSTLVRQIGWSDSQQGCNWRYVCQFSSLNKMKIHSSVACADVSRLDSNVSFFCHIFFRSNSILNERSSPSKRSKKKISFYHGSMHIRCTYDSCAVRLNTRATGVGLSFFSFLEPFLIIFHWHTKLCVKSSRTTSEIWDLCKCERPKFVYSYLKTPCWHDDWIENEKIRLTTLWSLSWKRESLKTICDSGLYYPNIIRRKNNMRRNVNVTS